MPSYEVEFPDGKKYDVQSDRPLTSQEAYQYALKSRGPQAPPGADPSLNPMGQAEKYGVPLGSPPSPPRMGTSIAPPADAGELKAERPWYQQSLWDIGSKIATGKSWYEAQPQDWLPTAASLVGSGEAKAAAGLGGTIMGKLPRGLPGEAAAGFKWVEGFGKGAPWGNKPIFRYSYKPDVFDTEWPAESLVKGEVPHLPSSAFVQPSVPPLVKMSPLEKSYDIATRAHGQERLRQVEASDVERRFERLFRKANHDQVVRAIEGSTVAETGLDAKAREGVAKARTLMADLAAQGLQQGLFEHEELVGNYFSHRIIGKEALRDTAVKEYYRNWVTGAKEVFQKKRRLPNVEELESWLQNAKNENGVSWWDLGLRVDKNPARVFRGYVESFGRAEKMHGLLSDLATSSTPEGKPFLIKFDVTPPQGYAIITPGVPLYSRFESAAAGKGKGLAVIQEMASPLNGLLQAAWAPGNRFSKAWDVVNNIQRSITMALPWKHFLFNVGSDAMWLTGFKAPRAWMQGREMLGLKGDTGISQKAKEWISLGGLDIPTVRHTIPDVPRALSDVLAQLPGGTLPSATLKYFERVAWERGVAPTMMGVAETLFQNFEAGRFPAAVQRLGMTAEGWARMSYPQKLQAVSRVVNVSAGQLPRFLFEDPKIIEQLRGIFFSPRWNVSNMMMIEAALKRKPYLGKAVTLTKGLSKEQEQIVRGMMQAYMTRSLAVSWVMSSLFNMWTTHLLLGKANNLWDNPEGYKTRIFGGWDNTGRGRWFLPPYAYILKDVGNFIDAGMQLGQQGDTSAMARAIESKLAWGPRMAGYMLYGNPYADKEEKLPGRTAAQWAMDTIDQAVRSFGLAGPLDLAELAGEQAGLGTAHERASKDPWSALASTAGVALSHSPTPEAMMGVRKKAGREFTGAIKGSTVPETQERLKGQRQRTLDYLEQKVKDFLRFRSPQ